MEEKIAQRLRTTSSLPGLRDSPLTTTPYIWAEANGNAKDGQKLSRSSHFINQATYGADV